MKISYEAPEPIGREYIELSPDITAAILLTLHAGWLAAVQSADVHAGAGEVAITERLRDGMRSVLRTRRFPWSKNMTILPGTESRSNLNVLIPDGRTDIPVFLIHIFLRHQEHDPHAIIECKRIAGSNSHLCREYVLEGVDRFCSGKYAENHAVGFMAGYLLAGSAPDAVQGVNAVLTRKSRSPENLRQTRDPDEPASWSSVHNRSANAPIILYHSFFGISGLPT